MCFGQVTLAKSRTAAAFSSNRHVHLEACRFKDFYRRDTDVWFMITNESIVPQHHAASGRASGHPGPAPEMRAESRTRVARQWPLRSDAQGSGHELPHEGRVQD